jgi:MFS family permease
MKVQGMFLLASAFGVCSKTCGWLATRGAVRPAPRPRASLVQVLRRFHPGLILLVGVAGGFGLSLPNTFLRTFADLHDIPRIGLFFGIYAPMAFLTRLCIRRLPEKHGVRPMAIAGLLAVSLGMLVFLFVNREWQLAFPAMLMGIAHALLFPAVVAGGSSVFPAEYRGVGTTLMLASFDLGTLIGMPTVGMIVHTWSYGVMFASVGGLLLAVVLIYSLERRGVSKPGVSRHDVCPTVAPAESASRLDEVIAVETASASETAMV